MSDLKTRPLGPDDLEAIRDLYRQVWGYSRPADYDNWRYFGSPEGYCPSIAAFEGERLAGFYTLWPVRLRIGSETVLGGQSIDTMTHPDYRGQGVFKVLANECYELAAEKGYRLIYGFPNPFSYPGFVKRLGWTHTGDITHWVRPLKPSLHPKVPGFVGTIVDAAARLLPRGSRAEYDVQVGEPPRDVFESQYQRWAVSADGCRIDRHPDWLSWRYAPVNQNDHSWVSIYQNGQLKAMGAWGMLNENWGEVADQRARLVELFYEDVPSLEAVLRVIIEQAQEAGAMLIESLVQDPIIERKLRGAGFFRHRQAPFIVKNLSTDDFQTDVLDLGAW